jgi:NADPH:quinone reductase and related Zn-dependent oxidoreductases
VSDPTFKAFRIHSADGRTVEPRLETLTLDDLSAGDVVIRGAWSSINYKDALAATGAGRILKSFPLVGGVDIAGTVVSSSDPRVAVGDEVIVNGLWPERDARRRVRRVRAGSW